MKYLKIVWIVLFFELLFSPLFAQKNGKIETSSLKVTILNNNFSKVNLVTAYGNEKKVLTSVDIVKDQFTMNVDVENDIYRLEFDDNSSMLVVLKRGESIDLSVDANNLQNIVSVTGSKSMNFVNEAVQITTKKKTFLDSLNQELQTNSLQKFWGKMAQDLNAYKQTNEDVDRYILAAFDNVDSLLALSLQMSSNGQVKKSNLDFFVSSSNKWLKELDNNYKPFESYLENAGKYYDFSTGRNSVTYADFYGILDQYIQDLNARHTLAESSLGNVVEKVKILIAKRDSLVYNNLMDQKKNKTSWADEVLALVQEQMANLSKQRVQYQQQMETNKDVAASLVNGSQEMVKSIVNGYQIQYNEMDAYLNGQLIELIKQNKEDIAVLMFLDLFPKEKNMVLHEEVISSLHKTYPNHAIVKERWNIMNSPAGKTAIGMMAPDLAYLDPNGQIRKLSDLKGKVVLIDFWASWCGPCRRESPNVRNVYAKYHDKGFEIYSVSLDRDAAAWKRAIQDDKLVWPNHVSDLKYWSSEAAAIYGVRSIPAMFLLDREGRIVAKDLRGEALEKAVKQLLGE